MTLTHTVPWLLTAVSLAHTWLLGSPRRRTAGWVVAWALLAPASAAYNVATGQLGFVAGQVLFAASAVRGWRRARSERPVSATT